MKRRLRGVAILGCAAVVGLACGRAPSPAAVPPSLPAACETGAQLPADVLAVPEPLPPIVNRSKVTPDNATAWARSFLRALRVEAWALAGAQDDLLASGCLGDPRAQAQLFGDEIYLIGMARRTHARIVVTPADVASLTLVELGGRQQALIAGDHQVAGNYAWLVTTQGPSGVLLTTPGGEVKVVISLNDGERAHDFYGGFFAANSWVGPIWVQQSYYSCVSTKGRSLCA